MTSIHTHQKKWGFAGGASGKESTCQCRRHKRCGFDPWVSKIPWSRQWQPTPVSLPLGKTLFELIQIKEV